ncbi:hypothetical protein PRIPAC_73671 [Pristionchus pacificus]|uniref:Uncharacterized protein n=1 Tax=Pristionchus pacificus TaxID=54126 RepID=A0A2A6C5M4_PRIPA|nr:hypothetical protein PRIPAC_73671 [Pristionchus pacificus]|eukprot:PDM73416.1 hypothetical protein PRIPAC_40772 [Pristionchus pacificus]
MSISPSPSSLLSSTRSKQQQRSPACRVLFPDAVAKAGPLSPCSAEMRLRPQLMPRKRPASAPLPPIEVGSLIHSTLVPLRSILNH